MPHKQGPGRYNGIYQVYFIHEQVQLELKLTFDERRSKTYFLMDVRFQDLKYGAIRLSSIVFSLSLIWLADSLADTAGVPSSIIATWRQESIYLLVATACSLILFSIAQKWKTKAVALIIAILHVLIYTIPQTASLKCDAILIVAIIFIIVSEENPNKSASILAFLPVVYILMRIILFTFYWKELPSYILLDYIVFVCTAYASFYLKFTIIHLKSSLERERRTMSFMSETINRLTMDSTKFLEYASLTEEKTRADILRNISREIHDIIGHTLTDVIVMMDANVRTVPEDKDEIVSIFSWVRDHSRKALAEARRVLYQLRNSIPATSIGLTSLSNLGKSFHYATGVDVSIDYGNAHNQYGQGLDNAIYRIVQESFVNSLKHGRATAIQVRFWEARKALHFIIRDNGYGAMGMQYKGIGQQGMEERIHDLQGTIVFKSNSFGYETNVSIPLPEREP